jgi:hypothetical protein
MKTETFFDQALGCLASGDYDSVLGLLNKSMDSKDKDKGYAYWLFAKASRYGLWGTDINGTKRKNSLVRGSQIGNALCAFALKTENTFVGYVKKGWHNYTHAKSYHRNRNLEKELFYLKKAATIDNNMFAQYRLSGFRGHLDIDELIKLKKLAANRGHPRAQYKFALIHKDYVSNREVYMYLKKATLQGYPCRGLWNAFEINHDTYLSIESCTNAVVCVLCLGKYHHVILYDIVKIIARLIYNTKTESCWRFITPESRKLNKMLNFLN